MKKTLLIFLITILIACNAHAFRSHGDVNKYLTYKRLELQGGYIPKACALIENDSNDTIYIFADLIFETRTKFVDLAKVHIKIPPDGKRRFCEALKNRNYSGAKDAIKARWDVYMLTVNGKQIYFRDSAY